MELKLFMKGETSKLPIYLAIVPNMIEKTFSVTLREANMVWESIKEKTKETNKNQTEKNYDRCHKE
jgi:hypothetical protein